MDKKTIERVRDLLTQEEFESVMPVITRHLDLKIEILSHTDLLIKTVCQMLVDVYTLVLVPDHIHGDFMEDVRGYLDKNGLAGLLMRASRGIAGTTLHSRPGAQVGIFKYRRSKNLDIRGYSPRAVYILDPRLS